MGDHRPTLHVCYPDLLTFFEPDGCLGEHWMVLPLRSMSTTALDGLLDPLASSRDPSALRQIIEFRISSEVQARVDYLAKRANNGELTPDEDAEYEALIDGADLITILKLKAQRVLAA